jgi:hypothetical protein
MRRCSAPSRDAAHGTGAELQDFDLRGAAYMYPGTARLAASANPAYAACRG